jgi:hypothetical protein
MGDFLFSNTGGFVPADLRNGSALKKDAGGVKFFWCGRASGWCDSISNHPLRHSRESGNPSPKRKVYEALTGKTGVPVMDSRFRGNDDERMKQVCCLSCYRT